MAWHRISPLHTHDTTGIVHIESAEDIPFTLQAHDQIVVWLGPASEQPNVNATYVFPSGL